MVVRVVMVNGSTQTGSTGRFAGSVYEKQNRFNRGSLLDRRFLLPVVVRRRKKEERNKKKSLEPHVYSIRTQGPMCRKENRCWKEKKGKKAKRNDSTDQKKRS